MPRPAGVDSLVALLSQPEPIAVLTGAGLSTGSGIPDYRGPTGRARPATPMTYQVFTGSAEARQRYWARAYVGWRSMARARPNPGHLALAQWERAGLLTGLITQNVDGLHRAAGSRNLIELHGALSGVVCLGCGEQSGRELVQQRLADANPTWSVTAPQLPDGDVDLDDVGGFEVVDCTRCGGLLKPDVVFFGESVPRDRVDAAYAVVARARTLLVLGSSLRVMSGYRFVLAAKRAGSTVAIVNQGETRGDGQADLLVDADLTAVLISVTAQVLGSAA